MIDVFYEESVRPSDSVKAGKKYKRTMFLSIMFLFFAIIFTIFFIMLFNTMPAEYFTTTTLPVLVICVIQYVLYFVLKSKKHNYLVDYDYTFVSGELRIAKVLNGIKRRPVAKIESRDITALGKMTSDKYIRYKTMPGIKIITATPNVESRQDSIYFIVCMYKGLKSIILIEPSANLVYNIKRFAGRTVDYV